jgi:glutamate/tyrosine decarboxylase-like PLP-dependent enzyme
MNHLEGYFTSGGSMSIFAAVCISRTHILPPSQLHRGTVYAHKYTHHSLRKAIKMAGIPEVNLRIIPPTLENPYSFSISELRKMIEKDKNEGFLPFLVCGTFGTTHTGVDCL